MDNTVIVSLGGACNNRCIYCKVSDLTENISTNKAKRLISSIAKTKRYGRILLTGGEPTIRKDFFELIKSIKKYNLNFGIATNLRRLSNRNFAEKLSKLHPTLIYASFPSFSKETIEKINLSRSFNEVSNGLDNILSFKSEIIINIVLNKINYQDVIMTIRALYDKGITNITLSKLIVSSEEYRYLELSDEELLKLLKNIKDDFDEKIRLFFTNFDKGFLKAIFPNPIHIKEYINATHGFEIFDGDMRQVLLDYSGSLEKSATIRISSRCNQNCIFCDVFENDGEYFVEKNYETIALVKRLARKEKISNIILTGGEPTLNKDLPKLVHLIKKENVNIQLQTNALLFSYNNIYNNSFFENINSFFISLPSHNPVVMDRLTRTPGSHALAVKGISNILKRGKEVKLNHVINDLNKSDILSFCKFINKNFKNSIIIFDFVRLHGRARDKHYLLPKISDFKHYLVQGMKYLKSKNIDFVLSYGAPPLCFFPEFKHNHAEFLKMVSNQADDGIESGRKLKNKPKICEACKYNNYCLGISKNYLKKFGSDEILPLR